MAVKSRSFVRNSAPAGQTYAAGTKLSANGVSLMSTGFAGLDNILLYSISIFPRVFPTQFLILRCSWLKAFEA
ncbi:hypothetical protein SUGI_0223030 [Cryptomeria japonica]|nr:hypothetical protein SUGI_0223030 [Cryptomeria japonica]